MAYYLYRHFSKNGELLYIGISKNHNSRICDHEKNSPWFGKIHKIDIQIYKTQKLVIEAEKNAIIKERPKYNLKHHPDKKISMPPKNPRGERFFFTADYETAEWIKKECESTGLSPSSFIRAVVYRAASERKK